MDFDDIYENYQIISMNTIPEFIGFEEGSEIEAMTGHYACAVTAMYTCATYYGTVSYSNMKADYMKLWNLSETFIDKTTSSGIILGLTPNAKQGPALVSFCSSKGKKIGYRYILSPSYSFFTTCIDRGDIAIFNAGIYDPTKPDNRSGHAMTVEGYATTLKYNSGERMNALLIYDGWNAFGRFLNINDDFLDTSGTEYLG